MGRKRELIELMKLVERLLRDLGHKPRRHVTDDGFTWVNAVDVRALVELERIGLFRRYQKELGELTPEEKDEICYIAEHG